MTTLENKLKSISIGALIDKYEALHKQYPNKLYRQFALSQREKYYKLTREEYSSTKR